MLLLFPNLLETCNHVAFAEVSVAAARPLVNTCGEKDLEIGVRKNHRANVAPFHDPAFSQSQLALKWNEGLPHLGKRRYRGSHQGAFRAANFFSDIAPIDEDYRSPIHSLDLYSMSIHQLCDARRPHLVKWGLEPIPYCQQPNRTVHRSGIQVGDSEAACKPRSNR